MENRSQHKSDEKILKELKTLSANHERKLQSLSKNKRMKDKDAIFIEKMNRILVNKELNPKEKVDTIKAWLNQNQFNARSASPLLHNELADICNTPKMPESKPIVPQNKNLKSTARFLKNPLHIAKAIKKYRSTTASIKNLKQQIDKTAKMQATKIDTAFNSAQLLNSTDSKDFRNEADQYKSNLENMKNSIENSGLDKKNCEKLEKYLQTQVRQLEGKIKTLEENLDTPKNDDQKFSKSNINYD